MGGKKDDLARNRENFRLELNSREKRKYLKSCQDHQCLADIDPRGKAGVNHVDDGAENSPTDGKSVARDKMNEISGRTQLEGVERDNRMQKEEEFVDEIYGEISRERYSLENNNDSLDLFRNHDNFVGIETNNITKNIDDEQTIPKQFLNDTHVENRTDDNVRKNNVTNDGGSNNNVRNDDYSNNKNNSITNDNNKNNNNNVINDGGTNDVINDENSDNGNNSSNYCICINNNNNSTNEIITGNQSSNTARFNEIAAIDNVGVISGDGRNKKGEGEDASGSCTAASVEGKAIHSSQTLLDVESKTEAEISNLLEKIHSSQEEKATSLCSGCGRRHHPTRMPWTHSTSCNPVVGVDLDEDVFLNAEDEDEAEPHLIYMPLIFDNAQVNNLLLFSMNLSFAMALGIYFDEKFLRLLHEHHPHLFPPPFFIQVVHFFVIVFVSFASLQRFWRTVLVMD